MSQFESMEAIIKRDEENRKALMQAFDALGQLDALQHLAYESNRRWKVSINVSSVAGDLYWFKISYELNKTAKRIDKVMNELSTKRKPKSKKGQGEK